MVINNKPAYQWVERKYPYYHQYQEG